jgi:ATP-dependent Clp protease ATP-binding subunit ClpA
MTDIPLSKISTNEGQKLLGIESELSKKIIGQPEAISKLSKAIKRTRAGVKNPNKPSGVFLFLGPTGVGKCICGDSEIIIRNKITGVIEPIKIKNIIPNTN